MTNRPTPEYLIETMTAYSYEAGHKKLIGEGYTISRRECRNIRSGLIADGVAVVRGAYTEEKCDIVRKMAAQGKTSSKIGEAIGATARQVYDLCYRLNVPLKKGPRVIPLPDRDAFNAVYQKCSIAKAGEAFGVSPKVAQLWVKAFGLTRESSTALEKRAVVLRMAQRRKGVSFVQSIGPSSNEAGPVADAARYLRQQGYSNVYRRSVKEWQVGARVMLEADMLARVDEMKARRARMMGGVV